MSRQQGFRALRFRRFEVGGGGVEAVAGSHAGDKWTLVVVRDLLLLGRHRFGELLASGEGISTNILSDRLERLESAGLVERRRYQERPPRYEYHLTASGRDLFPVLRELVLWGNRHIPGTFEPPPGALDEPPG